MEWLGLDGVWSRAGTWGRGLDTGAAQGTGPAQPLLAQRGCAAVRCLHVCDRVQGSTSVPVVCRGRGGQVGRYSGVAALANNLERPPNVKNRMIT